MLRNLPEGARYTAATAVDHEDETHEPLDPRTEAVMDHRVWTTDRRLQAMTINAIYSQVAVSGNWGKGGAPHFPTVGPSAWRADDKHTKTPELRDNFDVLRKMGWTGGS